MYTHIGVLSGPFNDARPLKHHTFSVSPVLFCFVFLVKKKSTSLKTEHLPFYQSQVQVFGRFALQMKPRTPLITFLMSQHYEE